MIEVIHPGIRAMIQDKGRTGYYHLGVPPAGAIDQTSFLLGNLLLGNPGHAAAIEMAVKGMKVAFHSGTTITVTGAPLPVLINGYERPMWKVLEVKSGDVLELGNMRKGMYSYLCVSGGLQTPEILESRSTCMASGYAGVIGRPLTAGDRLPVAEPLPGARHAIGREVPADVIPPFGHIDTAHVVLGITSDLISDNGLVNLLNQEWKIQPQSNRTACNLAGGHIEYTDQEAPFGAGGRAGNIVDIPYPIGAVIVPNEQEIIILLRDGTGGGGFVTIGAIINQDIDLLAQKRPMETMHFQAITIEQAMDMRRSKALMIEKAFAAISR